MQGNGRSAPVCSCYKAHNNPENHVPTCPCYQPNEEASNFLPKRRGSNSNNKASTLSLDSCSNYSYSDYEYQSGHSNVNPCLNNTSSGGGGGGGRYYYYGQQFDSTSIEGMFPPRPPSIATSLTSVSSFLDSVIEEPGGGAGNNSSSIAGDAASAYNRATNSNGLHRHTLSTISNTSSIASCAQTMSTEIFHRIFSYLDMADLKEVAVVNREWYSMAVSVIWRKMVVPMDKRVLSGMKSVLAIHGHRVHELVIVPPDSITNSLPLSRRTSITPATTASVGGATTTSSGNNNSNNNNNNSLNRNSQSFSYHTRSRSNSISSTPQMNSLGSINLPPNQNNSNNSYYYNHQSSQSYVSESSIGSFSNAGRRHFRTTPSPSPSLSPSRNTPIPGTPGIGNMPIESIPLSMPLPSISGSYGSQSSATFGGPPQPIPFNASNTNNNNTSTNNNSNTTPRESVASTPTQPTSILHNYPVTGTPSQPPTRYIEVSESTIARLHRYMEAYCPNVMRLTVLNPLGIGNPERRYHLLDRFFDIYPSIDQIDVSQFIMWEPNPLRAIPEKLHALRELDVSGRVELSDSDIIPIIQGCLRLTTLKLRATNISDTTIKNIVDHLKNTIQHLNISGCRVTSIVMAHLATHCHALKVLRGWSCLPLGDDFLLALKPKNLPCLQVLDLKHVFGFSAEAVQKTFGWNDWPQLQYLRIHYKGDMQKLAGLLPHSVQKLYPSNNNNNASSGNTASDTNSLNNRGTDISASDDNNGSNNSNNNNTRQNQTVATISTITATYSPVSQSTTARQQP
ncbi:hypothetical protein H4219_004251 [Mycoemilia scoparia]|uniref:F-box domain-containing protein n=1 Tax=Mycoemilia scoparia TaxID=417184 RepID=A0A9W7ZSA9_9FUNG|nr:hypothetical protein H4219_004251 [Mycoemilia scoparia]